MLKSIKSSVEKNSSWTKCFWCKFWCILELKGLKVLFLTFSIDSHILLLNVKVIVFSIHIVCRLQRVYKHCLMGVMSYDEYYGASMYFCHPCWWEMNALLHHHKALRCKWTSSYPVLWNVTDFMWLWWKNEACFSVGSGDSWCDCRFKTEQLSRAAGLHYSMLQLFPALALLWV